MQSQQWGAPVRLVLPYHPDAPEAGVTSLKSAISDWRRLDGERRKDALLFYAGASDDPPLDAHVLGSEQIERLAVLIGD